MKSLPFQEIWAVDFEFGAAPGEQPEPRCMVAKELRSGRVIRLAEAELRNTAHPPMNIGTDALYVAYYASAEMGCHLKLGWQLPKNLLDLYAEFRNHTNGLRQPDGAGLLGALTYFCLPHIGGTVKDDMRQLAIERERSL